MKITPRATVVRAFSAPTTLLAILMWCHCLCYTTVHARSAHLTHAGNNTAEPVNCDLVRHFFDSKNVTFAPPAENLSKTKCGGECCSEEMEEQLKQQARTDFHNLIHHHSRSLQGLFATTAEALRETVKILLQKSENNTLVMFNRTYGAMAAQSGPSIRALYRALADYVSPENTSPDNLQPSLTRETLQMRFAEFFARMFPNAYHFAINPTRDQQDFTETFKSCLRDRIDEIQPFGDVPQDIYKEIAKSLEATRVLVQAFNMGRTILDKTDGSLFAAGSSPQQDACYAALLRMTYCPRCRGIRQTVQPCHGFCTNVIRGCLTEPTSQLDLAWSGYVDAVDKLIVAVDGEHDHLGLNLRGTVQKLDGHISIAIMHAMEAGPQVEEKVRKVCGRPELLPSNEVKPASSGAAARSTMSPNLREHAAVPPLLLNNDPLVELHKQLGNFVASVAKSRIFYGTLADAICEDYPDRHCWNGEQIGDYGKTVAHSSVLAQKYNPEFSSPLPSFISNTNTSALIDQLRHINKVISQLTSSSDIGAFQGDEAVDGSGSGDSPSWRQHVNGETDDDEDGHGDDRDDDEASGSGMGPTTTDPSVKIHHDDNGSSTILLSSAVVLVTLLASLVF